MAESTTAEQPSFAEVMAAITGLVGSVMQGIGTIKSATPNPDGTSATVQTAEGATYRVEAAPGGMAWTEAVGGGMGLAAIVVIIAGALFLALRGRG